MRKHQSIEMNAISLNNMGVVSFENSRLDEALDLFQAALAFSKRSICEGGDDSSSGRPSNTRHRSGLARMAVASTEIRSLLPGNPPACAGTNSCTSSFDKGEEDDIKSDFLYLHPLRVSESLGHDNEVALNLNCSLLCVFNLAVTSHCRAIQTTDSNLALSRYKMAVKLYELSYSLVLTTIKCNGVNADTMLITLAIINNVGVIHNQTERSIQAHQCFERLLSCMVYLRGAAHAEMYISSCTESYWEGFHSNVVRELNILKQAISAPSA
jgi:tetratricopeptide (TPR) repeat protein